jgi:hypothetical protein
VARESDFGKNDTIFYGRTHLGSFLNAGDLALGYDLARFVSAEPALDEYLQRGLQLPDFVLVRKCFDESRAKRRKRKHARTWKVKRLDMEVDDANIHARRIKASDEARQADEEQFLQVKRACALMLIAAVVAAHAHHL